VRVVIATGFMHPGSNPAPDPSESLAAYSDLRTDRYAPDVDWSAAEFEGLAEQEPGGALPT
jgi:hypothetical protein